MKTTDEGYINKNNQKNLGYRGLSETHTSAKFYEMECLDCGHKYMANGCDIWLRKCPNCAVKGSAMEANQKIKVDQEETPTAVMSEPEVSLRIAMYYIAAEETCQNIVVSIDGAHVRVKNDVYFDVQAFMRQNGYTKCDGALERWQGEYQCAEGAPHIIISSKSGIGDVTIVRKDGKVLYVESKKFRHGNGGIYPAIHEAIGQLMTGCPDFEEVIPVAAIPYTEKSMELCKKWSQQERIRQANIHFMLVCCTGEITLI